MTNPNLQPTKPASKGNPVRDALIGLLFRRSLYTRDGAAVIVDGFLLENPVIAQANEAPKNLIADDPETVFRAGFLAGCSFGMDQGHSFHSYHSDSPDVDAAWEEYKSNYLTASPKEVSK